MFCENLPKYQLQLKFSFQDFTVLSKRKNFIAQVQCIILNKPNVIVVLSSHCFYVLQM